MKDLEDGYEFVFPGDAAWVERLANFVAAERECCRFFEFEILLAPDLGPIALRMRGPAGTKESLEENLTDELIGKLSSRATRP